MKGKVDQIFCFQDSSLQVGRVERRAAQVFRCISGPFRDICAFIVLIFSRGFSGSLGQASCDALLDVDPLGARARARRCIRLRGIKERLGTKPMDFTGIPVAYDFPE